MRILLKPVSDKKLGYAAIIHTSHYRDINDFINTSAAGYCAAECQERGYSLRLLSEQLS